MLEVVGMLLNFLGRQAAEQADTERHRQTHAVQNLIVLCRRRMATDGGVEKCI